MSALICGSLAYDTIMVFPDQFEHLGAAAGLHHAVLPRFEKVCDHPQYRFVVIHN